MNTLTRYTINFGERVAFDENTYIDFNSLEDEGLLLHALLSDEDLQSGTKTKIPDIISVVPGQRYDFYGISLKAPNDAIKMAKWTNDSLHSAFVFFLNNNDKPVDNAFAYLICMDNWVVLGLDGSEIQL